MKFSKRLILIVFWWVSFLFLALSSWAKDTPPPDIGAMLAMNLEELVDLEVEIATGVSMPTRLAPAVASVITADQIEAMGAVTLSEILETVAGLHVSPSSSADFSSIWSIRGIHTSVNPQVLLLINGIPLSHSNTGGRPYTYRMPVAMISRVEVVRGPGSAVHGADAFSGTVNVITKNGHDIDGTEAGIRYGSFNSSDLWLQHGGIYMGWDIYAGVETQNSDGDTNRVVEEDFLNTAYGGAFGAFSNTPAHLDTEYDQVDTHFGLSKDKLSLRFYGSWLNNNGMGPGGSQAITYNGGADANILMADLEYRDKEFAENLDLSLRLYSAYIDQNILFEFYPPAIKAVPLYMLGNPIADSKDSGFESTALYQGIKDHMLRFSMGWRFIDSDTDQFKNFGPAVAVQYGPLINIKGTPFNYREDQNRKIWNVSLQDEWNLSRDWTLTAGVRYDYYDDFGSTTNPRVGLVWETKYDLTTKLMYGHAFRAPSFGEQYLQNNPQAWGNPDLEPEEIDTYELAFDYQPTSTLRTKLNLFIYDIENLIEYITHPTIANALQAQNYKDQKGHGCEVEMHWEPTESIQILSTFAYQRSKDKATKEIVPDAPEMQLYLNPHWRFLPDWSLNSQLYWIAGRHRENGDPRGDIDDYEIVNLTLRRENIAKHFDFAVSVKNLFDEDIREPSPFAAGAGVAGAYIPNDYPMESRAIWAEVRAHF